MPASLIARIAQQIAATRPDGIARVAIDGPDAAELRGCWDLSVYLHVSPEETLRRAANRDRDLFGDELQTRYLQRYLPGQAHYRAAAAPLEHADIVVGNDVPETPKLLAWRC